MKEGKQEKKGENSVNLILMFDALPKKNSIACV